MGDEVLLCPNCGEGEKHCLTLTYMPDAMRRVFFKIDDEDGIEMFKTVTKEKIKVYIGDYGNTAAVPIKKGFSIMPKYVIKFNDYDIVLKQTVKSYVTDWDGIGKIVEDKLGYEYRIFDKKGGVMATMRMKPGPFKVAIETYSTDFRLLCIMAIIGEAMHKVRISRPAGI